MKRKTGQNRYTGTYERITAIQIDPQGIYGLR